MIKLRIARLVYEQQLFRFRPIKFLRRISDIFKFPLVGYRRSINILQPNVSHIDNNKKLCSASLYTGICHLANEKILNRYQGKTI